MIARGAASMPWLVLVVLASASVVLGVTSDTPSASLATIPISGLYLLWRRVGRPVLRERQLAWAIRPEPAAPADPPRPAPRERRPRRGLAAPRPRPGAAGLDAVTATAERFLVQGRTALLRRPEMDEFIGAELRVRVSRATGTSACFVPPGPVLLENFEAADLGRPGASPTRQLWVEAYRIDRTCVSNADYLEFVADGGYERPDGWDPAIRSRLSLLIDQTGRPGPRFWVEGSFPTDQAALPVVGVCWYEADAFARWAGRRLPTCGEWVRAALMPTVDAEGRVDQKPFPWGEAHDVERTLVGRFEPSDAAALAQLEPPAGPYGLVPVDYDVVPPAPSGAVQMVGNVWEWTNDAFPGPEFDARLLADDRPFKTIRGGASASYPPEPIRPALASGDLITARRPTIGFRCAWDA